MWKTSTVPIYKCGLFKPLLVLHAASRDDAKEKLIDVTDEAAAETYRPGDRVWVKGQLSMGIMAVLLAFVVPFLVLVVSLFVFMAIWNDELGAALGALFLLVPYYFILWLNKSRLGKKFSFSIQPMN